jgi:hypothetical protein
MDAIELRNAIRDLATLDADGRLSELVEHHAVECRKRDLPLDGQLVDGDADFAARIVGRAAATLLGLPTSECVAIASDVLRLHPRQDVALDLIDDYLGRGDAPAKKRRRDW